MKEYILDKIKKIDLRKVWKHEASDFTRWLAEEENISLLSDEIGIEIKTLQTGARVGRFNVDILAEEENTGRKIIIENQLASTNHDHLGKIITYAAGYDADFIIWIVKDFKEEHKSAIDWLNENSKKKYFFAIEMELWQIGSSNPAPKFKLVAEPNEWAKALDQGLGETKLMQLDFWSKFKEYAQDEEIRLSLRKPRPQHWYDIAIGISGTIISLTINSQQNTIGCGLYIYNSKKLFTALEKYKSQIEKEIGFKLIWMPLPNKQASRIKIEKQIIFEDQSKWIDHFEWMKNNTELFHKIFTKYIRKVQK